MYIQIFVISSIYNCIFILVFPISYQYSYSEINKYYPQLPSFTLLCGNLDTEHSQSCAGDLPMASLWKSGSSQFSQFLSHLLSCELGN